jgi:putative membrane protein
LTIFTAATLAAQAQNSATGTSPQAEKFLKEAARGNDFEVALAEVGSSKAENPDLKSFAQQMQQDHLQVGQQLKPLAQKYGVSIAQSLNSKDQKEITKFQNETGTKFDQELATRFLREHQKAIKEYEHASQGNFPDDVKQFAQATLPKLQEHFQHAQTVAKAVGVDQSTISSIVKGLPEAVGGTGTAQEPEPGVGAGAKTEKGAGAKQLEQGTGTKPPGQP